MRRGARLGEHGRQIVVVAGRDPRNLTRIDIFLVLQINRVVNGGKRQIVEHLGTFDGLPLGTHLKVRLVRLQLLHLHDSVAGIYHAMEIDHGRGVERIKMERAHRHFGEEGQCAFGADDGVGDDVKGIIVGNKRPDVESRHVLDGVFSADAVGKRLVGPDLVAQGLNAPDEVGMGLAELLTAVPVASVQHRAVGKDDAYRLQHVVGVGVYAAAHAGGIVDDDAADHRTVDGGGVWGEKPPHGP